MCLILKVCYYIYVVKSCMLLYRKCSIR
jgi:hypothetical protein